MAPMKANRQYFERSQEMRCGDTVAVAIDAPDLGSTNRHNHIETGELEATSARQRAERPNESIQTDAARYCSGAANLSDPSWKFGVCTRTSVAGSLVGLE